MTKMDYVKKDYDKTRTMPGSWYLSSYKYKFDLTHMQPFLEKLKEKKLIGLQCQGCNTVSFPPKIICGKCLIKPEKWVPLRETATISTFTIAYQKDENGNIIGSKPVVAVRQDGADTLYTVELSPGFKFEDAYVGMPVKVHWKDNPKGSLDDIAYYDPIEDPTKDMPLRKE